MFPSRSISLVEGRKLEQQHTPSFQTWSTKSFNFWNKMKSILNNAQHLKHFQPVISYWSAGQADSLGTVTSFQRMKSGSKLGETREEDHSR